MRKLWLMSVLLLLAWEVGEVQAILPPPMYGTLPPTIQGPPLYVTPPVTPKTPSAPLPTFSLPPGGRVDVGREYTKSTGHAAPELGGDVMILAGAFLAGWLLLLTRSRSKA